MSGVFVVKPMVLYFFWIGRRPQGKKTPGAWRLGAEGNIAAWGQICWRKMTKRFENHGAAIQTERTKRGSRKIVCIGAMFADVVILPVGVVLGGGRQREEKTNEENTVYRFLPTLQNT